jgi:hypothetical protein
LRTRYLSCSTTGEGDFCQRWLDGGCFLRHSHRGDGCLFCRRILRDAFLGGRFGCGGHGCICRFTFCTGALSNYTLGSFTFWAGGAGDFSTFRLRFVLRLR